MEEEYLSEEMKAKIMKCHTFDELLDVQYGPIGTPTRDQFEKDAKAFILAERRKNRILIKAKNIKDVLLLRHITSFNTPPVPSRKGKSYSRHYK